MPPAAGYHYRAFELDIASEFALDPYLEPASRPSSTPDLAIAWNVGGAERTAESLDAEFPGQVRVHLRGGREAWLTPGRGAGMADVVELTCGPILAMALAQRGLFVLHAAGVALDGLALAFTGHSGSGKSTTAAVLAGRGGRLLADDFVPLVVTPGGIEVIGGPTPAKLSEVPAPAADHVHPVGVEVMSGKQLCRWARVCAAGERTSLAAIVLIEDGPRLRIERLRGQAAASGLLSCTFSLPVMGAKRQVAQLGTAAAVAAGTSVVRLVRPRTLAGAVESAELAWQWAAGSGAGAG